VADPEGQTRAHCPFHISIKYTSAEVCNQKVPGCS